MTVQSPLISVQGELKAMNTSEEGTMESLLSQEGVERR